MWFDNENKCESSLEPVYGFILNSTVFEDVVLPDAVIAFIKLFVKDEDHSVSIMNPLLSPTNELPFTTCVNLGYVYNLNSSLLGSELPNSFISITVSGIP